VVVVVVVDVVGSSVVVKNELKIGTSFPCGSMIRLASVVDVVVLSRGSSFSNGLISTFLSEDELVSCVVTTNVVVSVVVVLSVVVLVVVGSSVVVVVTSVVVVVVVVVEVVAGATLVRLSALKCSMNFNSCSLSDEAFESTSGSLLSVSFTCNCRFVKLFCTDSMSN